MIRRQLRKHAIERTYAHLTCAVRCLGVQSQHSAGGPLPTSAGESWYIRIWQSIVQTHASGEGTTGDASLASTANSAGWRQPSAFLRTIGNRLPDSAVSGLWALFHSLECGSSNAEAYLDFFVALSCCGPDLDRVRTQQKRLASVTEAYEAAVSHAPSESAIAKEAVSSSSAAVDQRRTAQKHLIKAVSDLEEAATPICERWFNQSTALPNGMRWLMDLRRHLLHAIQTLGSTKPDDARLHDLRELDQRLLESFREFFSKQYLVLEELSWKSTPPYVLERVIASESVHPFVRGLESMKLRIRDGHSATAHRHDREGPAPHRHLFALYHPAVAEEPLVSVQVALTSGIANSVDVVLQRPSPLSERDGSASVQREAPPADTVIFYSINNAQSSLKGVELGSMLIKRVVAAIQTQPYRFLDARTKKPLGVVQFSTLSPIPGFIPWLRMEAAKLENGAPHRIFGSASADKIVRNFDALRLALGGGDMTDAQVMFVLLSLVADDDDFAAAATPQELWFWNKSLTDALKGPMMQSVAAYLVEEKRRGRVLDPVGNFHVGNGAIMHRINWLGNCTEKGSKESACMMVNYKYDLDLLSDNALKYELERKVPLGKDIEALLSEQ